MAKMPHYRNRHLVDSFLKLTKHAKIIGILGHRQVGKTTFLEENAKEYISLDDQDELRMANTQPKNFLAKMKGELSAIDECQLAPPLFSALKLRVQNKPNPGQYLLSGSVRLTSRRAIRESLTGRISNIEMLPLTVTEIDQEPLSTVFIRLLEAKNFSSLLYEFQTDSSLTRKRQRTIEKYFELGGLPGICFIRNAQTRKNILSDILETMTDRDVRLVYPTTVPYSQILDLCREISNHPMDGFKLAQAERNTHLSAATIRKLITALESIFLIRKIPIEGDYSGNLLWFEDQVERYYFQNITIGKYEDWISCVYRQVRSQFGYSLGFHPDYFHYKKRSGAQMPFGIKYNQDNLGVFPLWSESVPSKSQMTSVRNFLAHYPSAKAVFISYKNCAPSLIQENIMLLPSNIAFY